MNLKQLALGVALATTSSLAGIIIQESDAANTLALTLKWSPESPNPESTSDATGAWHWDVKFTKTATHVIADFNGTHVLPLGPTFSTTLSVPLTGGTDADFDVLLDPPWGYDIWNASLQRNPSFLPLVFNVGAAQVIVPEAQEYALLAGLGLVGFGAWRRFRKA
jgi:hypothetical protein